MRNCVIVETKGYKKIVYQLSKWYLWKRLHNTKQQPPCKIKALWDSAGNEKEQTAEWPTERKLKYSIDPEG